MTYSITKKTFFFVAFALLGSFTLFAAIAWAKGTAPAAPTLSSVVAGDSEVDVTWTAPKSDGGSPITDYLIKYVNKGTTKTVSTKTSKAGTYTVTGLTNGVTYTFSVAAVNAVGTGTYSSTQDATPAAAATAPDAPTLDSATASDGEVVLVWTPGDDGGSAITGYGIAYSAEGGGSTNVPVGAVTTYTVDGLTNDIEYTFSLKATNTVGTSGSSNALTATPVAAATVPGTPRSLTATPSDGQMVYTWLAPADDGGSDITGYTLSYTPYRGDEVVVDLGLVTEYTATGLTNGLAYTSKVRAVNAEGVGPYSSSLEKTPFTTPDIPTGLAITAGDGSLALTWTGPSSNGSTITNYIVSYTNKGTSESAQVETGSGSNSYLLTGLTNGVDYQVSIQAENSAGLGSATSNVTAAPDAGADPAIVGLPEVTAADTTAKVVWETTKAMSTKALFGLLEIARETTEINKVTRTTTHTAVIENLIPCTTYSFKVYSKDALENTVTSSEQTFTTTGCEGGSDVEVVQRNTITVADGGLLDFTSTDIKSKLTIPRDVTCACSEMVVQAKKLLKESVENVIGAPNAKNWIDRHVYKFTAYKDENEVIEGFDKDVLVTIDYTLDDIVGIDRDTLAIYHYEENEEEWHVLDNCTNVFNEITQTGTISCYTDDFSTFVLASDIEHGVAVTAPNEVEHSIFERLQDFFKSIFN
jgi:hypothetical protein